jgi:hypothetical protein
MSTADGQTFARDLRDSQGRQLLKPSITVSKLKKVPRKVTSLEGLTSPLEPLGIRLSAGWAGVPLGGGLRRGCQQHRGSADCRSFAEFGSSSLTVRAQSFAPKILETSRRQLV